MGMVVRTNTMALNAYRQLGMNNSAVSKSLEKLSSGFRINRAGDDAAGLAISEKMKAQIKGLETASANAQDGISLIQTAEGNLNEVHDMLNRMVELSTKSANGTYTATERQALQDEVDQLLDEIDRISQSANFNGTRLLDGTMGLNQDAFTVGTTTAAAAGGKITLSGFPAENVNDDTKLHLNTPGQAQQGGSFTIDLADYELDTTNATGKVTVKFGIQGKEQQIEIDCTTDENNRKKWTGKEIVEKLFNEGTWVDPNDTLADGTTKKCPDDGNTYAALNHALYKVEIKEDTKLTFTYAGATENGENATENDEITDEMVIVDQKTDKTVTASATVEAGKGTVTGNGSSYHGVLDIKPMQKKVEGQRAGIEFDLAQNADLFKDGATLTIDGKTFTFKVSADADITADNLIDLSKVKGAGATPTTAEYAKAAAMELSNYETDHFQIGDGGSGKIKVDQTVEDYDDGNNAPYTKYEDLTGLFSAAGAATDAKIDLTVDASEINSGDAITVGDKTFKFVEKASANPSANTIEILKSDGVDGLVKALNSNGFSATNSGDIVSISKPGADAPAIIGGGLTLQIGDTADPFNKMNVSVADMSAKGLGLENLKKVGIMTENSSSEAIQKIKDAINTVSSTRAGMGALQNRLEHTINNLDVAAENLSAANSRIRDTDMAKEMMNYTKMNVLVQSAQAMLAQANQQPQSVLQLLQ